MVGSVVFASRIAAGALVIVSMFVGCGGSSDREKGERRGTGGASGAGGSDGSAGESGAHGGDEVGGNGGSTGGSGRGGGGGSATAGAMGHVGGAAGTIGGAAGGFAGQGTGGPMAGTGGLPSLPLPEGCEPRTGSEDAQSCKLGLFCGPTPNLVNCRLLASGNWQCSCELAHNDRIYEIDGAPGLAACAIAGGLCADDELDLGTETCATPDDTSSSDACTLDLECGRPIDVSFASGVQAWLMEYAGATCGRAETGEHFICQCDRRGLLSEYDVLAESGTTACRPLADFCIDGTEPDFDGPLSCLEPNSAMVDTSCRAHQTCAQSIPLTDEVSLAKVSMRYATCDPNNPSGSDCHCSMGDGLFLFDVAEQPEASVCAESVLNCDEDAVIAPQGTVDCQPTSQFAWTDSCDADHDCRQMATVDGRPIEARGRLLVRCARLEAGQPWRCSCASNQDSTIYELGAASSGSWDACGAAREECLERMPVFIGPYGEFVDPPDPLSPE